METTYTPETEIQSWAAPIRYRWLNALIVGATILVWLTLAGMVATAIIVGVAADSIGGGTTVEIGPTGGVGADGLYVDALGGRCLPVDVDANGWCP